MTSWVGKYQSVLTWDTRKPLFYLGKYYSVVVWDTQESEIRAPIENVPPTRAREEMGKKISMRDRVLELSIFARYRGFRRVVFWWPLFVDHRDLRVFVKCVDFQVFYEMQWFR